MIKTVTYWNLCAALTAWYFVSLHSSWGQVKSQMLDPVVLKRDFTATLNSEIQRPRLMQLNALKSLKKVFCCIWSLSGPEAWTISLFTSVPPSLFSVQSQLGASPLCAPFSSSSDQLTPCANHPPSKAVTCPTYYWHLMPGFFNSSYTLLPLLWQMVILQSCWS